MKYLTPLSYVLFWVFLPFALVQGAIIRLRNHTPVIPDGEISGRIGQGSPVNFLAIGDSVISGIGLSKSFEALPFQLASALAHQFKCEVQWWALGLSGAKTSNIISDLLPQLPTYPLDVIVISVGVNEVTSARSRKAFQKDLIKLINHLLSHSPQANIVLIGVPPMSRFPNLPYFLKHCLGHRSTQLDRESKYVATLFRQCHYVNVDISSGRKSFAEDGYHPSAQANKNWALKLVQVLDSKISSKRELSLPNATPNPVQ